jgi:hypothetical protein
MMMDQAMVITVGMAITPLVGWGSKTWDEFREAWR